MATDADPGDIGRGDTVLADAGARLRRLEDLEQIRRLFMEYKVVLDRQDFAAYADLFAEDGEFVAGPGVAKGRAAIREMVEAMPASGLLGRDPGDDYHVIVNPLIELDPDDPDRAHAELTWLYVVKGDDASPQAGQARPLQRHPGPRVRPLALPAPRGPRRHRLTGHDPKSKAQYRGSRTDGGYSPSVRLFRGQARTGTRLSALRW